MAGLLASCQATKDDGWKPHIFQGTPEKAAIVRGQSREVVECKEPSFKDYLCVSQSDLERLFRACLDTSL